MSGEQLSIYPSSEPIQKKVPNLADFLGAKNLLNEKNHDAHSRLMTEFATSNNFPQYNSPEYKKLREQKAQEEKTKPLDQYFGGEGKLTKMSTTFYEKGIDIAPTLEHYKDIINTHLARPANSNLTNMEYEQLIANIKKLITNTLLSNNDLLSDITDANPQWIISNAMSSSTEKINSSLIPSAYFLLEMHSGDNMEKYTNLKDNSIQARRHIKMRDREISESLLTAKIGDNEEIPTGLIGNDSFFSMSGEENMRGDNYLKYIKFENPNTPSQSSEKAPSESPQYPRIVDIQSTENPSLLNEEYKAIENKANIAMMAFAVASMIPYAGATISLPFDIKDIFSKENALVEFLKGRNAIDPRYNPGKEGYEHILALGSVVAMPIGAQGVFKTPKVLELMEKIRKIKIDPKIFSDIIGQIAEIFHMDKNTLNSLFNSDNSMQTAATLAGSTDRITNGATKPLEKLNESQSGMVVEGTRSRANKITDLPKAVKLNEEIRAEALSRGVDEDMVRKEWIMRDFGYDEAQADAVIRAHHIKKPGEALGNYGPESLGEKMKIMEAAGVDYRKMLQIGYAGELPTVDPVKLQNARNLMNRDLGDFLESIEGQTPDTETIVALIEHYGETRGWKPDVIQKYFEDTLDIKLDGKNIGELTTLVEGQKMGEKIRDIGQMGYDDALVFIRTEFTRSKDPKILENYFRDAKPADITNFLKNLESDDKLIAEIMGDPASTKLLIDTLGKNPIEHTKLITSLIDTDRYLDRYTTSDLSGLQKLLSHLKENGGVFGDLGPRLDAKLVSRLDPENNFKKIDEFLKNYDPDSSIISQILTQDHPLKKAWTGLFRDAITHGDFDQMANMLTKGGIQSLSSKMINTFIDDGLRFANRTEKETFIKRFIEPKDGPFHSFIQNDTFKRLFSEEYPHLFR